MEECKILNVKDEQAWNEYFNLLSKSKQDVYFTPQYYKLHEEHGDGKAKCFVFIKDNDFALYPFLINSINELGYKTNVECFDIQGAYGFNGVISTSNESSFKTGFKESFHEFCKQENIITEFTRFHPLIRNESFSEYMEIIGVREMVLLDLCNEYDFIWNKCYSSVNRNMIRKAVNQNISASASDKIEDYHDFIDIHDQTMKNVGAEKYFYFSENYFLKFRELLNKQHRLVVAKKDGKSICAMLLFINGDYAHYHLSGRVKEYSNTGVNNLILDEAIKIAKQEGCKMFHLGGGNSNEANDSLLKFKSDFSKQRVMLQIGKKIHNHDVYNQIVNQWSEKFPEKAVMYKNFVLKYRY